MSDLKTALEDYLAVRRKLGFKLHQAGNLLHDFVNSELSKIAQLCSFESQIN